MFRRLRNVFDVFDRKPMFMWRQLRESRLFFMVIAPRFLRRDWLLHPRLQLGLYAFLAVVLFLRRGDVLPFLIVIVCLLKFIDLPMCFVQSVNVVTVSMLLPLKLL